MAKRSDHLISFDNYRIPVKVYKEWRSSVRFSLAKRGANIRLPHLFPNKMVAFEIARLEAWLKKQINKNDRIGYRFLQKEYKTNQIIELRGQCFQLKISIEDRKTNVGKIVNNELILKLNQNTHSEEQPIIIRKLIERTISKYFHGEIERKVMEINEQYFSKEIKSVRLKDNQSNWGSCSSKGNINLSSRLLLAPDEILDYVIIHELSHLIEMNHSSKFWKIVSDVMPDYKDKEKWLHENGHSLKF